MPVRLFCLALFLGVLAGTLPASAARFDGKWTLKYRGGDDCLVHSYASVVVITGNRIVDRNLGGGGMRAGTVSRSGAFRMQGPNSIGSHDVVISGRLNRRSGRGTLTVVGGRCTGTVTLRKR